jgi:hypothetical protein
VNTAKKHVAFQKAIALRVMAKIAYDESVANLGKFAESLAMDAYIGMMTGRPLVSRTGQPPAAETCNQMLACERREARS